jgi:uncharacterized membrane protein YidH (DUF202 family)
MKYKVLMVVIIHLQEPKVFFANERTFLSWLNFTVVLGASLLLVCTFPGVLY